VGIEAQDVARVRDAADIVAVIGEHTEIKRVGSQWMARCPLHGERTPSLSVSSQKGVFYCFGCQRSGDVITFVQEIENLDFVGAVEMLAARAGIRLRYTSPRESAARNRRKKLIEAIAEARDFYHERLLAGADAGLARAYLRGRGYTGETVRQYRVGWAPEGWDLVARRLELSDGELRDSGLGLVNSSGAQQDFFRARVMFPISDERGQPVGFGGRLLPGAQGPKYINTSAAAKVYDKSKILYGLHEHRRQIVKAGQAVVCEGYTDVIGCAQAGIDTAVATCGTALTGEHVALLKRFSADRLVLAFDADAAGGAAAERVYAWEREHGVEARVADLPEGADPGDLARSDPDLLRRSVNEAVPLLQFRVDRVLGRHHMASIEDRAVAAENAAAVVAGHPDDMVRENYLMSIADRCRVEIRLLRRAADPRRARRPPTGRRRAADAQASPSDAGAGLPRSGAAAGRFTPEDEVLRIVMHRPEEISVDLHGTLFGDPLRREAFEAWQSAGSVIDASETASDDAAALLRRLAVDSGSAVADDVLARLASMAVRRTVRDLHRSAASSSPELRGQCIRSADWLMAQSELLSDRGVRSDVLGQLIPWLTEYGRRSEEAPPEEPSQGAPSAADAGEKPERAADSTAAVGAESLLASSS